MGIENIQPGQRLIDTKKAGGLLGRVILNIGGEFPLGPAQHAQFIAMRDQLARRNYAAYFVAALRSAEILRDLGRPPIEEVHTEIVDAALNVALDQMEVIRKEVANTSRRLEYSPDRSIARLTEGVAPLLKAFPTTRLSKEFEGRARSLSEAVGLAMKERAAAAASAASSSSASAPPS